MSRLIVFPVAIALCAGLAACASLPGRSEKAEAPPAPVEPVVYSNMEEVYFDKEAKKEPAPWLSVKIDETQEPSVTFIDAFGQTAKPSQSWTIQSQTNDRLTLTNGTRTTELRRARPVSCWAAVKKDAPKAFRTETRSA
jgi:hypothetical protein